MVYQPTRFHILCDTILYFLQEIKDIEKMFHSNSIVIIIQHVFTHGAYIKESVKLSVAGKGLIRGWLLLIRRLFWMSSIT